MIRNRTEFRGIARYRLSVTKHRSFRFMRTNDAAQSESSAWRDRTAFAGVIGGPSSLQTSDWGIRPWMIFPRLLPQRQAEGRRKC